MNELVEIVHRERSAALLGVLNTTPDSFFDGGHHESPEDARARVDALLDAGADIIDIGSESTRPGSSPIDAPTQITRLTPALEHALARDAFVSIDTTLPEVADFALRRGAHVINDVSCLAHEELARVTARHGAILLLMHSRGAMSTMESFSSYPRDAYEDVIRDVTREWSEARDRALRAGVRRERIWFDPGLGFHKNAEQSAEILRRLPELQALEAPIVIGASRKSFIGVLDSSPPAERLGGSIAAALCAVAGGAHVLRVHDVRETRQALLAARSFSAARAPEVAHA